MTIVFYSDSKYEYQINSLITSFKLNNIDCNFLYYTIGFESNLNHPRLTKKLWPANPRFKSFCFYKAGICYDAIKTYGGNMLFLDSDIMIGRRFNPEFFIHDKDYPLASMGNWNFPLHYTVVDQTTTFPSFNIGDRVIAPGENFGNIVDIDYQNQTYSIKLDLYEDIQICKVGELEDMLVRDYKKLASYYNTDKKMGYVYTCILSFNERCIDFISEWKSITENDYLNSPEYVGDYYPFHEETAINVTYWKRGITENYGRLFVNTLNSDVVKYVEENDNIVNENIFNNPNQKCESSNKTQLYHGIVNKEEIDKVLEYLESKTF